MRFKRFLSRGFGCLPDGFEWTFPDSGLILIVGNNEQGKSTFVRGMLSALYGLPQKPREASRFRELYAPWQNPAQGPRITLEVEDGDGKVYAIARDFDARSNAVRVTEAHSREDCSQRFQQDRKTWMVGETFTRLSRATFEKSALLLQNTLQEFKCEGDLIQAIEKVVDSGESGVTAQEAVERLEKALRQRHPYKGTSWLVENIIKDLNKDIEADQKEALQLQADYDSYQQAFAQLDQLIQEQEALSANLTSAQRRVALAEYHEAKAMMAEQTAKQQEMQRLEAQLAALAAMSSFPSQLQAPLQEIYGQYRHLQERLKTYEAELSQLTSQMSQKDSYLSEFIWKPELAQFETINRLLQKLEDTWEQYTQARDAFGTECQAMQAQAEDTDRFLDYCDQFADLPLDKAQALVQHINALQKIDSEMQTHLETVNQQQAELDRLNQLIRKRRTHSLCLILAGLGLMGSLLMPSVYWYAAAPGVALIIAGIYVQISVSKLDTQAKYVQKELAHAQAQQVALTGQKIQHTQQLDALEAKLVGDFPWVTEEKALADLAWYMERKTSTFASFMAAWDKRLMREQDLQGVLDELNQLMDMEVDTLTPLEDQVFFLEPRIKDFRRYEEACLNSHDLMQQVQAKQAQVDTEYRTLATMGQSLEQMLADAGVTGHESFDAGMAQFNQALKQHQEYLDLQRALAAIAQHLRPEAALAQYHTIIDRFQPQEGDDMLSPGSILDERDGQRALESELERLNTQITDLKVTIQKKQDHFNREYPLVQARLAEKSALRDKHQRFFDALNTSLATLRAISEREYQGWSTRLNERVNTILTSFNSPYKDIRFTSSLQFSFLDLQGREYQQTDAFESLSCGAKDQIYLAIRLAITDYLSQDCGHLPLILDDPFVNFDDERFLNALDALAHAGANGQQILLFSCHKQRHQSAYEQLAERYPDSLFLQRMDRNTSLNPEMALI